MEAVSTAGVARFQTQHFGVDDGIAQQHDQPLNRTHEFNPRCSPAHALRNRQFVEAVLDDVTQEFTGLLALNRALYHQLTGVFAVRIRGCLQVSGGRARARSEPFCRFGGLAVGIKGDLGGWAVQGFFFVFLFGL